MLKRFVIPSVSQVWLFVGFFLVKHDLCASDFHHDDYQIEKIFCLCDSFCMAAFLALPCCGSRVACWVFTVLIL